MKKFSIFLVIILLGIQGLSFANEVPQKSPGFGVWVKIHMKFHKPKTGCQTGFGICFEVTAGIDGKITNEGSFCPAKVKIDELNQLYLLVSEEDLVNYENSSTLPYFKNKDSITIDEPFTFSPETTKSLGSIKQITIRPGTYPIQYSGKLYSITFPF